MFRKTVPVTVSENKPVNTNTWTCACGAVNTGNFCQECGTPKIKKEVSVDVQPVTQPVSPQVTPQVSNPAKSEYAKPDTPPKTTPDTPQFKFKNPAFAKIAAEKKSSAAEKIIQNEAVKLVYGKSLEEIANDFDSKASSKQEESSSKNIETDQNDVKEPVIKQQNTHPAEIEETVAPSNNTKNPFSDIPIFPKKQSSEPVIAEPVVSKSNKPVVQNTRPVVQNDGPIIQNSTPVLNKGTEISEHPVQRKEDNKPKNSAVNLFPEGFSDEKLKVRDRKVPPVRERENRAPATHQHEAPKKENGFFFVCSLIFSLLAGFSLLSNIFTIKTFVFIGGAVIFGIIDELISSKKRGLGVTVATLLVLAVFFLPF